MPKAAPTVTLEDGSVLIASLFAAPTTSVRVPKEVDPAVIPLMVAPPDAIVMLPFARGVPAVGRTWMPAQVIFEILLPPSTVLTVMVIVLAVTVAVPLLKV